MNELSHKEKNTLSNQKSYSGQELNVGDTILFGNFIQADSETKKPIEWLIIQKEGRRILAISKYCLAYFPYNEKRKKIIWTDCDLRKWLNEEFYNCTFNSDEQQIIDHNHADKISILSKEEVEKYFEEYTKCIAKPTEYLLHNNASLSECSVCGWWLCSPDGSGNKGDYVCAYDLQYVKFIGNGFDQAIRSGMFVNELSGVRPVVWLFV